MHIFFSGIGGTGIGPLALIAKQAGYSVSGSDLVDSSYIGYLRAKGITNIHIGQTKEQIEAVHSKDPIDWFVYSSAQPLQYPNSPEPIFCDQQGIKKSKRDELLNKIIADNKLKLIAVAGTHGKTTTTAMIIWLFDQLKLPLSYSVGAKISFGDMGHFDQNSQFFVYECDEFDRNFLAFNPYLSTITGIAWDHHEIYASEDEYINAFRQFLDQSQIKLIWKKDLEKLQIPSTDNILELNEQDEQINQIKLLGYHNRGNGWQAVQTVHQLTQVPTTELIQILNNFPGLSRRFEQIVPNLYSDYAHTPEKVAAAISAATELAEQTNQAVVVVYEPLTNRRMHYTKQLHKGLFENLTSLYWVPSYLAREDPNLPILSPSELIEHLSDEEQALTKPMQLDSLLKSTIEQHLENGDLVLCLSGGGGNSLDEWLRENF